MMKQVLCLTNLIHEQDRLLAQSAVHDDGKSPAVRAEKENHPDKMLLPSLLLQKGMPQKNTFIHYDIPMSPRSRPPTPTSSAPCILLRRLFKTKADDNSASDADAITELPMSSLSSESVLSTRGNDTVRNRDDFEGKFEQDSEASTSAAGSVAGSPFDKGEASALSLGFAVNANPVSLQTHKNGQCTPCNYFWYKVDGCRQGSECSFCHLCPKGEIKKRKKDKLKDLRRAGVFRR